VDFCPGVAERNHVLSGGKKGSINGWNQNLLRPRRSRLPVGYSNYSGKLPRIDGSRWNEATHIIGEGDNNNESDRKGH